MVLVPTLCVGTHFKYRSAVRLRSTTGYSPYGTPEAVAEFLRPYIDAGCSTFNVIPCAHDDDTAIAAVGELRNLLRLGDSADPRLSDLRV